MPTTSTTYLPFERAKRRVEAGDFSFEAIGALAVTHGEKLVRDHEALDRRLGAANDVRLGALTIPMSEALEHYRSLRHDPNRDDAMQSEIVALWNAIQAADKRSKGIPVPRLPFNPRTADAIARLVAKIA